MRSIIAFFLILINSCIHFKAISQEFKKYAPPDTYSRGILCTDSTIYTSNSNGTISSFKWDNELVTTFYFGKEELRDLVCMNNELLAMESGEKGIVFRATAEKTDTLSQLYAMAPTVFFDGFDNFDSTLFLMGDPQNGVFSLFYSSNFGQSWRKINGPEAKNGEAGFAASGTNVQVLNDSTFIFVSGGEISRFFKSVNKGKNWTIVDLPFKTGTNSSGAFSIHMKSENVGIVVGGNYEDPTDRSQNCFITDDGGNSWKKSIKSPNGYRSCVIEKNGVWYACGTTGLDYSTDNGLTWNELDNNNFFSLAADEHYVYATASKGLIYRFHLIRPWKN